MDGNSNGQASRSSNRVRRPPARLSPSGRPDVVPAVSSPATTTATRGRGGRPRGSTRRVVSARVETLPAVVSTSGAGGATAARARTAPPPGTASTSASGPSVANPAVGSGGGNSSNALQPQPSSPSRAMAISNLAYFECVVCLENLDAPTALTVSKWHKDYYTLRFIHSRAICTTGCGHLFHTLCIQKWLSDQEDNQNTCPSCRMTCDGKMTPLYPNTGGTGPQRRGARTGCGNSECGNLAVIHETLCSDLNEVRAAFRNVDYQVREVQQDLDIRTAELASVEDINADLERQIADLKSAAEKAKSGSIKRRRRSHKD